MEFPYKWLQIAKYFFLCVMKTYRQIGIFLVWFIYNILLLSFVDLCSSEQLPEVEIFSLLEEQIPKYKIRADSITSFVGYENQVINGCLHWNYWINKWFNFTGLCY